jgi:hypothetical protein
MASSFCLYASACSVLVIGGLVFGYTCKYMRLVAIMKAYHYICQLEPAKGNMRSDKRRHAPLAQVDMKVRGRRDLKNLAFAHVSRALR